MPSSARDLFEPETGTDTLEEARTAAQDDRHDVELQLVDETGGQVLVDDVGAAADEDVLVAGRLGAPGSSAGLDAVGDERERRVRRGSAAPARMRG